jgi:hypothetical protein
MGDDNTPHPVAVLKYVREIGDEQIHTEHLLAGKHEPGIDDDDIIATLESHHVLADFAQSPERDDAKSATGGFLAPAAVARGTAWSLFCSSGVLVRSSF